MPRFLTIALAFIAGSSVISDELKFKKIQLTDKYYCDGVTSADINGDSKPDIVAGPFWFEGPKFMEKHAFYTPVALPPEPSPSNSMFSFAHDFDADGDQDILVLGRVHKHEAKWYENPGPKHLGEATTWKSHAVFERVRGESPTLVDLDGDGVPQLICHWDGRWGWIEPNAEKPTERWKFVPVSEKKEDWPQFYHGEGVGDVNGDGRLDLIINDGWFEQPSAPSANASWKFHRERFSQERGGAQMFAFDIDGDGDNDVVSAKHAHEWGLAWYENMPVGESSRFREHTIMGTRDEIDRYGIAFTQPHAMTAADLDNDGLTDLVTGKRRWAHGPKGDIEPSAEPVVAIFLQRRSENGVEFKPQIIDRNSGVGVQVEAADMNGDGRLDVMTASKLGVFLFTQE